MRVVAVHVTLDGAGVPAAQLVEPLVGLEVQVGSVASQAMHCSHSGAFKSDTEKSKKKVFLFIIIFAIRCWH